MTFFQVDLLRIFAFREIWNHLVISCTKGSNSSCDKPKTSFPEAN